MHERAPDGTPGAADAPVDVTAGPPQTRRASAVVARPGSRSGTTTGSAVPPVLPRTFVPRARLFGALDAALGGTVTTVTAPAGAGKTTGVAGWWRTARPGRPADVELVWVSDAATLSPAVLHPMLVREATGPHASAGAGVRIVVVDGAERLTLGCVAVLDDVLDGPPDGVHVVLLSRWDVPLQRLVPQLLGRLTDIRGDVLRMDDDEAHRLARLHAPSAPEDEVRSVVTAAQGWCAAVVLGARAVRGAASRPGEASRGPLPAVGDLLAREVFASLSPRERHVLLCVCHQGAVTAHDARSVTNDPGALDVLERLEQTGLLVQRDPGAVENEGDPVFRVHPVLLDLVRRRFAAGGVDVQRARATIARAAEIELARGNLGSALERAWIGGGPPAAVRTIADHGLLMVLRGEHRQVREAARAAAPLVQQSPAASLAVGVERWLAGDPAGAALWLEPVAAAPVGARSPVDLAVARLLRGNLGLEPVAPAVRAALDVVDADGHPYTAARRSLLLTLLGAAQSWLGDLRQAESRLGAAVLCAGTVGAHVLESVARADLALTEFMRGREAGFVDLALRAGEGVAAGSAGAPAVPVELARVHTRPWDDAEPGALDAGVPVPLGPLSAFWSRLVVARALALRARVAEARTLLDSPLGHLERPRHLEVVLQVERALLGVVSDDVDAVRDATDVLAGLGAAPEEALCRGLVAALHGQVGAGRSHLRDAVAGDAGPSQPDTRTIATVALAQLTDAAGASADAEVLLRRALVRAEQRRNALAFVGWLGHATPVHLLLERLAPEDCSPWARWLRAQAVEHGSLATRVSLVSPTPRESRLPTPPSGTPLLTPRERDVLLQLARGATYDDIAATLFVSTNTVKTHVASLYTKLGARRRSEALAAARNGHLL